MFMSQVGLLSYFYNSHILNFSEKFIDGQEVAPVLFWIYGGALVLGSNTYDEYGPNLFMDQDLIVVAVNYRLSSFGFLSTVSEDIPGKVPATSHIWTDHQLVREHGSLGPADGAHLGQ